MLAGAHAAEIVLNAAGDGKVNANEAEPLTPEARSRLTASVDAAYARMVQDIAAGRGVLTGRVRTAWKAHIYGAREARSLGMIDRIETLNDVLQRLAAENDRARGRPCAMAPTTNGSPCSCSKCDD